VRKSENAPGPYSLSVRDSDDVRGAHVKHYKIRYPDAKVGYFIAARRPFTTLDSLIDYYKSERSMRSMQSTRLFH
jgi:tyrosine-protein kinase Fyn